MKIGADLWDGDGTAHQNARSAHSIVVRLGVKRNTGRTDTLFSDRKINRIPSSDDRIATAPHRDAPTASGVRLDRRDGDATRCAACACWRRAAGVFRACFGVVRHDIGLHDIGLAPVERVWQRETFAPVGNHPRVGYGRHRSGRATLERLVSQERPPRTRVGARGRVAHLPTRQRRHRVFQATLFLEANTDVRWRLIT